MVKPILLGAVISRISQPRHLTTGPVALITGLLLLGGIPNLTWAQSSTGANTERIPSVDQRWLPWIGCWQLVEETGAQPDRMPDPASSANLVLVCVTPAPRTVSTESTAVLVTSIADGEEIMVETLLADESQQPMTETECTGWRSNTWSDDGARLFTRAEFACADSDTRIVSGVSLMSGPRTWLDIELVQTEGRGAVTVRRYRRASDEASAEASSPTLPASLRARAQTAAGLVGTTELSVADVIEAASVTDLPVLEAMLIETQTAFALNGDALLALDDSDVPAQVIDLMVALSFPDEFVVNRPAAQNAAGYSAAGYSSSGFVDTWGYGGYGLSSWYPYYARPFGSYYGWSPYSSLYYLGPATHYAIVPGSTINGSLSYQDSPSSGRVYQGLGYTRQDPAERHARPIQKTGTTRTAAGARTSGGNRSGGGGRVTSGGYSRGGSSGRSSGGSSGRSSGGSSGRSSGGSTGRAVPRP